MAARSSLRPLISFLLWAFCLLAPVMGAKVAWAQGRAGAETEEEKVFNEAEALFNAGRYAEAAPLYDRALSLNPTREATFVKRATLYFRDRRYDRAIDLLQRAEKLAPDDLSLKTVLGLCLYQSGQTERGLAYLQDVVTRRPENYEAQLQIGQYYAQSEPDRAITALELYFRYRPESERALDPPAQYLLGTAYYLKGRFPEAQGQLEAAHKERPRDIQTTLMLGAVALSRGDFRRAVELHEPLSGEIGKRPRIAYNLGQAYLQLGQKAEARRYALLYQGRRPDDPRGAMLLGDVALSGKDADPRAALRAYDKAEVLLRQGKDSSRDPSGALRVRLRARVARAHLAGGDPATALLVAEQERARLGKRPEGGSAGNGSAAAEGELYTVWLKAQLAQAQGAGSAVVRSILQVAEQLAILAPGDAAALALCGDATLLIGNLERARRFYADALRADRKLPRARAGMARTLQRLAAMALDARTETRPETRDEGLQAAVALLEEALPLDDTPLSARNLAVVYLMQSRPADAERVLARFLKERRGDVLLLRLHARALLDLGQPGPSLKAYEQALAEADGQKAPREEVAPLLVELGGRYLDAGKLDEAVTLLLRAERDGQDEGLRHAVQRNLAQAYLSRGRARLLEYEGQLPALPPVPAGNKLAEAALDDLQKAAERYGRQKKLEQREQREASAALCAGALAAVDMTRYQLGRELLSRAQDLGGCELTPPYDRLGIDLLRAYISYRDTGSTSEREQAFRSLPKLQGRAGPGLQAAQVVNLVQVLQSSASEMLAYDFYAMNKLPRAALFLQAAQKLQAGVSRREGHAQGSAAAESELGLQHNRAIVELSQGRPAAERVLERLAAQGSPPEALLNLGILHDRRGDLKKALELYRRALLLGQRPPKPREWVPRLREWINIKERILGPGGPP